MKAREALAIYKEDIRRLVAETGCANPRIIGSVARGDDTPKSDLDILVNGAGVRFFEVCGLQERIAELIGVPVTVLMEEKLKPAVRSRVLGDAVPL